MGNIRSHWQCKPPQPPLPLVWGSCKFPQQPRCRHQTGKQEGSLNKVVRCTFNISAICASCHFISGREFFSRQFFSRFLLATVFWWFQIGSPHSPAWLASACPPPGSWSCSRRPHLVADPLVAWDKNLTYSDDLWDWTCCSCCLHLMNRFLPGMGRSNNK